MRRSAAPSFRQRNTVFYDENQTSANQNENNPTISHIDETKTSQIAIRNTSSILELLSKNHDNTNETCSNKNDVSNDFIPTSTFAHKKESSFEKAIYTVVWGKKSMKKHKTWEGDGVLEVCGYSAVLKNEDGNVLGKASNLKSNNFEDGLILNVGSKEVQIIEKQENINVPKNSTSENTNSQSVKRKAPSGKRSWNSLTSIKRKVLNTDYSDSVILPSPPHEHQWKHNVNNLPVIIVAIEPFLTRILRPHQIEGVIFLYRCILGFRGSCYGAILADEMGLGKTIQCIALIWTLLKQGPYGGIPVLHKVLIVTPSSLVMNWQKEFYQWLTRERIKIFTVDSKNKPKDFINSNNIPIMIISYEMMIRHYNDIKSVNFDLIICDEGHRLKNSNIKATALLNQMNCKRRLILTGTPIQNDLQEFYSLVSFIDPIILGNASEYHQYYEIPIVASQALTADNCIKHLGEKRALELNEKTSNFILRRTQEIIDKYLPTKQEIIIFCKMSSLQNELYRYTIDFWANRKVIDENISCLAILTALKKICNHPLLLKEFDEMGDNCSNLLKHLHTLLPKPDKVIIEDSIKLKIVDSILNSLTFTKERIVIVSCFTQTLNMLAELCDHRNYNYSRLDGNTPTNQRLNIVNKFNEPYSKSFIFLLSAKAGGVGLNLTGASRLLLYDSDWNPATDLQAMSRIWRDGQKKSVYLYRLLTAGTIEEKIFQRQISKTGLSNVVVDFENKDSIKFSEEELKSLLSLKENIDTCLTHESLNCNCSKLVFPNLPSKNKNDVQDTRDCQLGTKIIERQNITINQLMRWEHHSIPFNADLVKDLGLEDVIDEITFIFRNKCFN